MPPVPFSSMFNPAKKLTNVPVELLYSRRKLFEKIVANIARRKIQNHVQATGDRMAVTPQQFGMKVEQQMRKQSMIVLPTTAIGAGLGALTAPTGKVGGGDDMKIRAESIGRGGLKGFGAGLGATAGSAAGLIAALLMATRRRGRVINVSPTKILSSVMPGAAVGGIGGYSAMSAAMGKPSWEKKT